MSNETDPPADPAVPEPEQGPTPPRLSVEDLTSALDALRLRLGGLTSAGAVAAAGGGNFGTEQGTGDTHEDAGDVSPNFWELHDGAPHVIARTKINDKLRDIARTERGIENLERASVPGDGTWEGLENSDEPYSPTFIDVPRGSSSAAKEGDEPDPDDPNEIGFFDSLEGPVRVDEQGCPLNPIGPTGLRGRGMLDRWGATPAADPILTRRNPETGKLEVLVIERGDTGEKAFPGGKVDEDETPADAAAREMVEEAHVRGIDTSMADAREVYAGYADDSRNTDNAWMETTALHRHLTDEEARAVTIEAGGIHEGEIKAAEWREVNDELYDNMFGIHGELLRKAVETMDQSS